MGIPSQVGLLQQLFSFQSLQLVVVVLALLGLDILLPVRSGWLVLLGLQVLHALQRVGALFGKDLLTLIEYLFQLVLLALLLIGS